MEITGKVLVTGGDGFIGSHLVEYLLQCGYQVRALTYYNSFNYWGHLEEFYKDYSGQLEVVSGDIRDPGICEKICEEIEIVFHLAALIPIPYSYIAPHSYVQTNVEGTLNMLTSALKNKVRRFVHTSTSEVYGTAKYRPIDENHPLNPQSPYAATKLGADKLAISFYLSFGLEVVVVRPFNTYGPRQSARAVIPTVILQALKSNEIYLGNVDTSRDFNYVSDTVEGIVLAGLQDTFIGQEINIGSGKAYKIIEIVDMISEILGKELKVRTDPDRIRPEKSEVKILLCSSEKIRKICNWQPKVSIQEGLKKTVEWFKRHQRAYKSDIYNV